MTSRSKIQSCCGSESYIYVTESPVLRKHVQLFKDAGFSVLSHYEKIGILQAILKELVITVSFGQNKINVRCAGTNKEQLLKILSDILDKIKET